MGVSNAISVPLPNNSTCTLGNIVTPIVVSHLNFWLDGYDAAKRAYLVDGFTNGFSIEYSSPAFSAFHRNHLSARENPTILRDMISTELSIGRVSGPFQAPPFNHFVTSPLGLIPKKSGQFRIIHDLSYPRNAGVNSFINDCDASVSYETLDDVVNLVLQAGAGALIAKSDIESAFRIIPICPSDRHLLGFMVDNEYYVDNCLPMGCRSSCAIFEQFSKALQWVAQNKLLIPYVSHILDDFIFIGPSNSQIAENALDAFLALCHHCNVPIKEEKTIRPAPCVVVHGIELDSVKMQARLPMEKIKAAKESIEQLLMQRHATLKELQSVIGLLNFACKVVAPGRPFLRRLINLTLGLKQPHHRRALNREVQADLSAWIIFLRSFNGISMFTQFQVFHSPHIKLFSDASGTMGFAGVCGSKWFARSWPPGWDPVHITAKEMFPITLICEIWGFLLRNRRILFYTDNAAVAEIVNKQTCKDTFTMELVRRLVVASLKFNIVFRAKHIHGYTNVVADNLSRLSFQAARKQAPWLDLSQTPLDPQLLHTSWSPPPDD